MSGFLNSLLPTLVLLGGLIFIHELGHFWAAKLVNIEVKRFSLGLGPVIWSRTWGETEYALSAIPLGGYVKMAGMADEVMDRVEGGDGAAEVPTEPLEPPVPGPRDFDGKPLWARAFVISAGVTMNFIFAFLAYFALFAFWGAQVSDTNRIGPVLADSVPAGSEAVVAIPEGARIERVGDIEIEHFGDLRDAILDASDGTLLFETVDPAMTIEVPIPPEESDRVRLLRSIPAWTEPVIGRVDPGSPADRGGIEVGDLILQVDGDLIESWWDFVRAVEPRGGQRVDVMLERDGQELVRRVELESQSRVDFAGVEREDVGFAGVRAALGPTVEERVGAVEAAGLGWDFTIARTGEILGFLRDLVTGQTSPRDVGSIVMIGQVSGQAADRGFDVFLGFMALFSLNLAVLNLLPIPVLDGGHLVFLALEAVRGRAISMEQRIRWSNVGLVVLMVIMVWALGNDFLRLFGI